MNQHDMKIGQLVKDYRIKANYTQLELSQKLGHGTSQFVSLFERGHSKIPLETLGKLVVLLQIPESKVKKCLLEQYAFELDNKLKIGKRKVSAAV